MEGNQRVWVADQSEGFVLGNITDLAATGVVVAPVARGAKPITSPFDRVFPAEEDSNKDVDDNCES